MIPKFQDKVHWHLLYNMNIFTTILTDSMTLNKSMSSANSLARTDDLLATAEFQKDKRDLGAKLSMKGINNIFEAEIKYSLIFGVKFQIL